MAKTFFLSVVLVGLAAGQVAPPFGTVLEQWTLQMSGAYAGAGVAWRRDEDRLYVMDQGYSGPNRVWRLDPADPENTVEPVQWAFTDFGTITTDRPWGIAWDADSGCFWMSQIVDGNIYAGCFLLRYEWNGSTWVWPGAPADSWLVGSGSNGGGLRLSWLAGFEKWPGLGQFLGIPILPPPIDSWHVRRFDPYTKDYIGMMELQTSPAALASVRSDSAYVLTARHTADGESLYKYDTTGYLHERAAGQYLPSDWTLVVPDSPDPADTACVFAMYGGSVNTLRRISTGMLWSQLPGVFPHSVRPETILAPAGAVDSGQTVTPRVVVRNIGLLTADSVAVHFLIDSDMDTVVYRDSAYVLDLPGRSTDTVEFVAWVPDCRDSMSAVCWTRWPGDSIPGDDTLELDFMVQVVDVAISAVDHPIPGDTIEPGPAYPQAELSNRGNRTETFPMVFSIGNYSDTVRVVDLLAGGSRTVTALNPWAATAGEWHCGMAALVVGDLVPQNNDTSYTFHVRGLVQSDMAVESIGSPPALIDTLPFTPTALLSGTSTAACTAWFRIGDSVGATVYHDEFPVFMPGWLAFRPCTLRTPGRYVAVCSVYVEGDTNRLNDTLHREFWVNPGAGIEQKSRYRAAQDPTEPTVVGGVLYVPQAGLANDRCPVTMLDIAGRKVLELKPGPNDIRHVAPGMYFIHQPAAHSRQLTAIRKVVVQR